MSGGAQQYCLRWNNHRSNLLTVFDELLRNEAFTDVTLACDGGHSVKCHKMVLAACSSYFQTVFTELPCRHPVVVLKDVKYTEMKAILEYMYRGEVNVAQDQLAALLKVAEALKVKGLVEENRGRPSAPKDDDGASVASRQHSPPMISTSSSHIQSVAHSSSNAGSPPHSSAANGPTTFGKSQFASSSSGSLYGKSSSVERNSRMNLPMWAVPGMPLPPHAAQSHPHAAATAAAAMLGGCYEAAAAASPDMSPLKRKKLSSLLMNRDTPILRTVLGQGQADSSQPVSLVCHPDSNDDVHFNGSHESEKNMKNEPSEDAQSPYTDISFMDDEDKSKLAIPSSSPLPFGGGGEVRGMTSGIATYVPQQKPEWKRYKQYTRNDIMSAIEAVRNGMSALQAARKYGVPSRTLYDKVKKLGITSGRPFKRGANGSSACFPYGLSGTSSPFGGHTSEGDEGTHSALLDAGFLQHALEQRGGADAGEREALAAMAAAAAAHHAAAAGHSTSPGTHGTARSPSPAPSLLKYMRPASLTPSPAAASETNGSSEREPHDDDDHVEDLSMARKPEQQARVIVPPMNQVSTIIKHEDGALKEALRDEPLRREIKVEESE